jgi:gas vesicle protein
LIIQIYKSNKGSVNVPVLDSDFIKNNGDDTIYANIIFGMNIVVWLMQ